jgi:ribosomal protein L16 Arg81 hydroxylase
LIVGKKYLNQTILWRRILRRDRRGNDPFRADPFDDFDWLAKCWSLYGCQTEHQRNRNSTQCNFHRAAPKICMTDCMINLCDQQRRFIPWNNLENPDL